MSREVLTAIPLHAEALGTEIGLRTESNRVYTTMRMVTGQNLDRRVAKALNTNGILGSQENLGASEELKLNAARELLKTEFGGNWGTVALVWEGTSEKYKVDQLKWRLPWQK